MFDNPRIKQWEFKTKNLCSFFRKKIRLLFLKRIKYWFIKCFMFQIFDSFGHETLKLFKRSQHVKYVHVSNTSNRMTIWHKRQFSVVCVNVLFKFKRIPSAFVYVFYLISVPKLHYDLLKDSKSWFLEKIKHKKYQSNSALFDKALLSKYLSCQRIFCKQIVI